MSSDEVEAVIRAARSGAASAPELFGALSDATLLLAVKPGAGGSSLPFVFSWNDHDHGAVFTSLRLSTSLPEAPSLMEIAGRELGRRWPDGLRAVINPGADDLTLVFDDAAMHLMEHPENAPAEPAPSVAAPNGAGPNGATPAEPQRPGDVPAGATVAVGAPAQDPPAELIDAVRTAVRAAPGVEAAYAFQLAEGGRSGLVIGVVLAAQADERPTVVGLADAIAAAYPPAAELDFLPLSERMQAMVAEHVPALR